MSLEDPIILRDSFSQEGLKHLQQTIQQEHPDLAAYVTDYPTVYLVHDQQTKKYQVYVGETNDIDQRTQQHLLEGEGQQADWVSFVQHKGTQLYVIGHPHFNKSLTLDIENTLMMYMLSVDNVSRLNNRRTNQQGQYYPVGEKEAIFSKIWRRLHTFDANLFPIESLIQESAIFKASPFHKLTPEQNVAKNTILNRISEALKRKASGQLILVEGDAGTGKTVLLSSLFFLINQLGSLPDYPEFKNLDSHLLVNHEQQVKVYQDIGAKLGLQDKQKLTITKPTKFINAYQKSPDKLADVVLVDEAHLLLTQGQQAYQGKNQLADLLATSRVVIAVLDPNQVLTTQGYIEPEQLKQLEAQAEAQDNLIELTQQMRIQSSPEIQAWMSSFVFGQEIEAIPQDQAYDLKIFDSPTEMYQCIQEKAQSTDHGLSRMIATFDWKYSGKRQNDGDTWNVKIDDFELPWNLQLPVEGKQFKNKAWAEQPQTLNEVGSTYTIQGFDLNYSGLIIGPSVTYRHGKVIFDPSKSQNTHAIRKRTMASGEKREVSVELLQHELNVLMTRGVNGLYIYAVDAELRQALLAAQQASEQP